jgi:iron complex transport system ATP-binding protein
MDGGALVADGAPTDVLTADMLARVYGITARIEQALVLPTGRVRRSP